ncbi:SseB family protein [Nesterenkonia sp. YGD6]|uniref:SseB family protein n=1 Tax=Nesterenkonia sp. YGD6 TaxID=2901231 RepID=UPI001F4C8DFB|nr:SseB family protein [Nesterenkonia sp. YGD6]MCH8561767.1 SseB family protein [Nesterenkonia sp. YGD6]
MNQDSAPSRDLPGHIAALLQRAPRDAEGRPADSAGIPWADRDLSGDGNPLHTFDGDDGLAAAAVRSAREQLLAGELDEAGFVNALAGQRLFVPVLAELAEEAAPAPGSSTEPGPGGAPVGDKQADITLISVTSRDGRQTMPVFTSVQALTAWHDKARPVAAETERIMLAALAEGAELAVLDPGAELTFVLRRPAVEALAQATRWVPSYQDPELAESLAGILDLCPGVAQLQLQPGDGVATRTEAGDAVVGGGSGPELSIGVVLAPGADEVDARLALASVQAALSEFEMLRHRADSVQLKLVR